MAIKQKSQFNSAGKASVWIESEIRHWISCRIAEARGEPIPDLPQDGPESPAERLLRWPEVERLTGIKRGHAHWLIREGRFPAQLKLPAAKTQTPKAAWVWTALPR